ncbi:MAG: DNA repair protein RecN [Actinomycetota bacterium]|nr:DNA repair protein RecN [Actinomycetota bacterium]
MFQEVRIQGVGVIDDAVLQLSSGLNVVTGETGAGKTMVVSGLGLLLGARADAGLVRAGRRAAVVEGVVQLPPAHPALVRAEDAGADVTEDLVLARSVGSDGRSRAHVGGRSTPVGVLAELGEMLVAVHGQADQWRLRQGDQHRQVVDDFGGEAVRSALAAYQETFDALAAAIQERDRLRHLGQERAREIDILQTGLERIETLDPQPGEDVTLRAEDERLAHADGLRLAATLAHDLIAGEQGYAGAAPPAVVEVVSAARAALAPMSEHDPALKELDGRVAELGYLAGDLAADLSSYLADVDVDPERLAAVQQRRADLGGLTRRYGDTVDDVLQWAKEASATLSELLGADERADSLDGEVARLQSVLGERAALLTGARERAAAGFAAKVTDELAHLAMGSARVSVAVTSRVDPAGLPVGERAVRWTRSGVDDVEILLSSGPGNPARSVAKAASGGELSRVMLAIEVVSNHAAVPTYVFDEVDAGVGGRAAVDVGARLAALARHAQVIVVTHLAQVAAFGDRHLVVRREDDGTVTSSSVWVATGDDRRRELSRMMGGVAGSTAGLAHAQELLDQAAALRGQPDPGGSRRRRIPAPDADG